jgi:K+-sensing histidine kinase KdpD
VLKFSKHDVIIRVRDTGEGLSDLAPPGVFEKYQRNGRTSEGQVTVELDLALVWATVEAHRGTVATQNTGTGSEFVITLPIARCTGELPQE